MSYYRGNWDLTYKNHKALKIVEIVIHYLSILCFFLQAKFLVEKFSLKYFLKSRTFTENLLVNFYICYFHFLSLFFCPWSLVAFEGGVGGKDGGGQNLGLWVEKREGGVREVEKGREEKVKKSGGNRD